MLKNVSVYYVYSKYKYVDIKFNNLVSGFLVVTEKISFGIPLYMKSSP